MFMDFPSMKAAKCCNELCTLGKLIVFQYYVVKVRTANNL